MKPPTRPQPPLIDDCPVCGRCFGSKRALRAHRGKSAACLMTPVERFWGQVDRTGGLYACWLWQGTVSTRGYGRYRPESRRPTVAAHRFAYGLLVGPIPEGLRLDHLCRVVLCVNPAHLEPVTDRVNVLRGVGPSAIQARKTYCGRGHPFDAANTSYYRTRYGVGRRCKACGREAWARQQARRSAA